MLERRTSTKQRRIRKVTLQDLIVELKRYEELEKERSIKQRIQKLQQDEDSRRMTDYSHLETDDIEELAHEESIENTIIRLTDVLERLFLDQEAVTMTELMDIGKIDKVSAFLALLFLSARGAVDLHQDEFYAEIQIAPDTTSHTPVADTEI